MNEKELKELKNTIDLDMKNKNNILETNIDALTIARYILYKEAFEDIGDYDHSAHLQNISLQKNYILVKL